MTRPHRIDHALKLLRKEFGAIEVREPRDPFELIVWENCAYLVDAERREATFSELRKRAGTTPQRLAAAGLKKIEAAILDGGMKPEHRAAKVLACAEIALAFAGGDLGGALNALPEKKQRALLKRFPGIADPGADRVLLFCGFSKRPALESNGLRVMERLGFVAAQKAYAASYREATLALEEARADALEAFVVLRHHGQTLCKTTNPKCALCPLRNGCPSAR